MARKALDNYPTHSSLARQLLGLLASAGYFRTFKLAFEPCAGAGQLARPLRNSFTEVFTNDVNRMYGADFHFDATKYRNWRSVPKTEWVITNPPFTNALPIIENSLVHARVGVAMLLRLTYLEPTRKKSPLAPYPRSTFWEDSKDSLRFMIPVGSPRPSFTRDGRKDSVTVAWFVWDKGWSWKQNEIICPFQFITEWKGT